jgi:hypothetical protein
MGRGGRGGDCKREGRGGLRGGGEEGEEETVREREEED